MSIETTTTDPVDQTSKQSIIEPIPKHRDLWNELVKETEDLRNEVQEYKLSKNPVLEPPPHREGDFLNRTVFPTLNMGLIQMLKKVKKQETTMFIEGEEYLNSLNFIAEYLWNMNPLHPERKNDWTDINLIYGTNIQ